MDGGCIDIRLIQDLLLMVFHTREVDEVTLAAVMPDVTDACLELAI